LAETVARAGYAFAVGEFLYRHTFEEAEPALYPLSRAVLVSLARLPESLLARQFYGYLLGALACLGFRPNFSECDTCRRHPRDDQAVIFDAAAGKIICRECRTDRPDCAHPYRFSADALAELRQRQEKPILEDDAPEMIPGALTEIAEAIEDFAVYHLGGMRLKSLDFARRVGSV